MTFEKACQVLNTKPTRSPGFLLDYAKGRINSFAPGAPLRYKVAAATILRHTEAH